MQDDWRPQPSLTFNLGLRYDYESAKTQALIAVNGEPGPGHQRRQEQRLSARRLRVVAGGDTRQVIYGGTGIYYDQVILNIIGNARFTPPKVIGIQIDSVAGSRCHGRIRSTAARSAIRRRPSRSSIRSW